MGERDVRLRRLKGEVLLREDNYNKTFANGGAGLRVLDVSQAMSAQQEGSCCSEGSTGHGQEMTICMDVHVWTDPAADPTTTLQEPVHLQTSMRVLLHLAPCNGKSARQCCDFFTPALHIAGIRFCQSTLSALGSAHVERSLSWLLRPFGLCFLTALESIHMCLQHSDQSKSSYTSECKVKRCKAQQTSPSEWCHTTPGTVHSPAPTTATPDLN